MKYLRIGDFSDVVGISVKTIRFYEEKGLIEPAYIDKYTCYTQKHVLSGTPKEPKK